MRRITIFVLSLLFSMGAVAEQSQSDESLGQYLNLDLKQKIVVYEAFKKAKTKIDQLSPPNVTPGVIIDSISGKWDESAVKTQIKNFLEYRQKVIYIKLKTLDEVSGDLTDDQKQKAVHYFLFGP